MAADFSQIEAAERQRDNRLRRVILRVLGRAIVSPRGGMHGRAIVGAVLNETLHGDEFQGETHALRLLRDLVKAGYATEQDVRARRTQPFGLDHLFFAISPKGSDLLDERIAADPMVDDERLLEE